MGAIFPTRKNGNLGIRQATETALAAFLSSFYSSESLISEILPADIDIPSVIPVPFPKP